jgi:hypothetical protein
MIMATVMRMITGIITTAMVIMGTAMRRPVSAQPSP